MHDTQPWLIADIGGTNSRFALYTEGQFGAVEVLATSDYPGPAEAITAYLNKVRDRAAAPLRYGALGIANPVKSDHIHLTNNHWSFSIQALQQQLAFERLLVLNDFSALALALPELCMDEVSQIGAGKAVSGAPYALLGAGTGFGVSGLFPQRSGGWVPIAGEGGHATLAPFNDYESALIHWAQQRVGHISIERFLSGGEAEECTGLPLLYRAIAAFRNIEAQPLSAVEITQRGVSGEYPHCRETIDVFCAMLGTTAANLVLTLGALGGLYIGGGIVPRLLPYFVQSPFRSRFEEKGRFSDYMRAVPTYVIRAQYPALRGAAVALAQTLTIQR